MSDDKNVFAENGEKIDKLVFRPVNLDMNKKVKKVSDPPPRPVPAKLDNRPAASWTPDAGRQFDGEEVVEKVKFLGNILKYISFIIVALGSLALIGWLVFWIMEQYNL